MPSPNEVPVDIRAALIGYYQKVPHAKIATPPEEFVSKLIAKVNLEVGRDMGNFAGFVDEWTHHAIERRGYYWNGFGGFFVDLRTDKRLTPVEYNEIRQRVMKAIVKRGIHFFRDTNLNHLNHDPLITKLEDYFTLPDDRDLTQL